MFVSEVAVGRSNVTPQHATLAPRISRRLGFVVLWITLFTMVLPATAFASPIGPGGMASIPGAPVSNGLHATTVSPIPYLTTPATPSLLGANPALNTPVNGPELAGELGARLAAAGSNIIPPNVHLTAPGPAWNPHGATSPVAQSPTASPLSTPPSSTAQPLSPNPAAAANLIVGNVSGTVVSSVTGLPLQGVSVTVYSVGSAICSVQKCPTTYTNSSGGYLAIGPAGADYVQLSLNWNLTNYTYVTVYPGTTTYAGTTELVPDGLAWGVVRANTTAAGPIGNVAVCGVSRDQAVTAEPCANTLSNGSFIVPVPPFPSTITFTPQSTYLTDFRFANATPHHPGQALVDLGTIYLTRLVLVQVELYDAVSGNSLPTGYCSAYSPTTCRAVTVCSSITGTCQTQGNAVGNNYVQALAVPGPSYVIIDAYGYLTNTVNIGNVSKLQPGHTFDAGKVYLVPVGSGKVKVGITTNKSGSSGYWGSGLWFVTISSMNGYTMGAVIMSVFGGINMTSTGTSIGGCSSVGSSGNFVLFPGRNDIALSPDATPTCNPPTPTWPIPGDFPVWGNETWANGTPDEQVNAGWLNLTPGSYIAGHVYTQGQTFAPRNYTVIAQSTESSDYTSYPFQWQYVYQYSGHWQEETNAASWDCPSMPENNETFCVAAPPGDSEIQVSSNNMPTNQTWVFTHNICCNGTADKEGIPLRVANLEHIQSVNLTPQGSVYGNVFRNGSGLGVAFGVVQVCGAQSNSVVPGVSCFNGVVGTNGAFTSQAPLGWDYITGTASGFEPNTVWAYVGGNHVFVGNISLTPVATLSGFVVGPSGGLLEAQVKTCLLSSNNACSVLGIGATETDGYYNGTLLGGWLPWATYEVTASASGYSTDWTFVNATPGHATTVPSIHLNPVETSIGRGTQTSLSGVWVFGTIVDNSTGFGIQTNSIQSCSVTSSANCQPFIPGSNSLGQFNDTMLPGVYNLTISPAGYTPVTVEFNITGVPTYNFGIIQLVPFPFVNGTSWVYPWHNVTIQLSSTSFKVIQLSVPATATACNHDSSVCGVGIPVSTQGTFFVNSPIGVYNVVTISPTATATSTSASGGVVLNNSIYNTTGWVTTLNRTISLDLFAAVFSLVMDNSSIDPTTGVAGWLPLHYNPAGITTTGPAHSTVTWDTNGGGWGIWFVPPGPNKTIVDSAASQMYTVESTNVTNVTLLPGGFYLTPVMGAHHFGFIDYQMQDSLTGAPIAFGGTSAAIYDFTNLTFYEEVAVTNGAGLVNVTSMYGGAVTVNAGGDEDYNSTSFKAEVNESNTTFAPAPLSGNQLGGIVLDHWGLFQSEQLNNTTGTIIPSVIDQTVGMAVPGVAVTVASTDSTYGSGSSQTTSYAGQFLSDAPIGKYDTVTTTRYAYLANTSHVAITPDLTVVKPSINVTADGVVAGLVVGLPSNTPISDAAVSLCTAKGACYQTVTNQSGVFWVLAAPGPGYDSVTATADGYVTNSSDLVLAHPDTWTWMGTIELSQFAYVYGVIRGLPSGLPLDLANAALCSPLGHPVGACGFTNITSPSGQFLLVAPAGTYVLDTSAPNYNASYRPIAVSPGQHVSVGTVFLEEFGTLEGSVYSATTLAPVPGAQVYACGQWGGASCTAPVATAPAGTFVVRSAPGPYLLTVSAPGFADAYVPAKIATGGISSLLPILLTPLGTDTSYPVSGTVVNASNPSQGVAGAIVSLALGTATAVSTQTDGSGAFSLQVVYGTYVMTVAAAGYHPLVRPLTVNGPSNGLQLTLAVMTYSVTGIALDGLSGNALSSVQFTEVGGSFLGTSASDGSFQLSLPNGTHDIVAQAAGITNYQPLQFAIVINGLSQVHDVSLVPSNELVSGVVANAVTGLASSGVTVTVKGLATDNYPITRTVVTDSAGQFSVNLPAGAYVASAASAGYYGVAFNFVVATQPLQLQFNLVPQQNAAGGSAAGMSGGGNTIAPLVLGLVGVAGVAVLAGAYLYRAASAGAADRRAVRAVAPTPVPAARGAR